MRSVYGFMPPSSAFWPGSMDPGVHPAGPERGLEPRAVVVLEQNGHEVLLGSVDRSTRCDLGLVDDLLRLQLHAQRLGWSIRIEQVRPELRELFELVGLSDRLDP